MTHWVHIMINSDLKTHTHTMLRALIAETELLSKWTWIFRVVSIQLLNLLSFHSVNRPLSTLHHIKVWNQKVSFWSALMKMPSHYVHWTSTHSHLSSSEFGKNWKSATLVLGEREQHKEPTINTQLFRTLKLAMILVLGHLSVQFCCLTVLQWVETLMPATHTFHRT